MSDGSRNDSNGSRKSLRNRLPGQRGTGTASDAIRKGWGHISDLTKSMGAGFKNAMTPRADTVPYTQGCRELGSDGYEIYNIGGSEIFISRTPDDVMFNEGEPVFERAKVGEPVGNFASIQVELPKEPERCVSTPVRNKQKDQAVVFHGVSGKVSPGGKLEPSQTCIDRVVKADPARRPAQDAVPTVSVEEPAVSKPTMDEIISKMTRPDVQRDAADLDAIFTDDSEFIGDTDALIIESDEAEAEAPRPDMPQEIVSKPPAALSPERKLPDAIIDASPTNAAVCGSCEAAEPADGKWMYGKPDEYTERADRIYADGIVAAPSAEGELTGEEVVTGAVTEEPVIAVIGEHTAEGVQVMVSAEVSSEDVKAADSAEEVPVKVPEEPVVEGVPVVVSAEVSSEDVKAVDVAEEVPVKVPEEPVIAVIEEPVVEGVRDEASAETPEEGAPVVEPGELPSEEPAVAASEEPVVEDVPVGVPVEASSEGAVIAGSVNPPIEEPMPAVDGNEAFMGEPVEGGADSSDSLVGDATAVVCQPQFAATSAVSEAKATVPVTGIMAAEDVDTLSGADEDGSAFFPRPERRSSSPSKFMYLHGVLVTVKTPAKDESDEGLRVPFDDTVGTAVSREVQAEVEDEAEVMALSVPELVVDSEDLFIGPDAADFPEDEVISFPVRREVLGTEAPEECGRDGIPADVLVPREVPEPGPSLRGSAPMPIGLPEAPVPAALPVVEPVQAIATAAEARLLAATRVTMSLPSAEPVRALSAADDVPRIQQAEQPLCVSAAEDAGLCHAVTFSFGEGDGRGAVCFSFRD